ncbi:diphthine methyltransferase [Bacillus rossius redtenbacheri]|uniref:diphthine methyltransferase n=1 Tax=Bacillus rossius redtenbacheri TaxID=93214 RepID=UPI002FDEB25D
MNQGKVEKLHTWDTVYSADSVEWCPIYGRQDILACGTYQIEPSDSEVSQQSYRRLGRLLLFRVDFSGLNLLEQHELPAILDLKWCHVLVDGKVLLAVANACGEVLVYELCDAPQGKGDGSTSGLTLVTKKTIHKEICAGETLMLSLDWSTARESVTSGGEVTNSASLVVSDSRGWITVVKFAQASLEIVHSWKAHDFEAWIAAFDYWSTPIVYSGGDDSKLHAFDQRMGTRAPAQTSRAHCAGVTSIHCNAVTENWLVSGSYDEHLRCWDSRSFRGPVSSTPLGGGVWRLKWDPRRWRHLLAACMGGGLRVVGCPGRAEPPGVAAEYRGHGSLAYGCDWCHLPAEDLRLPGGSAPLVATCSFYDHSMHVSCVRDLPYE